ncbi:hypothetical protein HKD37_05G012787 [Glycine soja]
MGYVVREIYDLLGEVFIEDSNFFEKIWKIRVPSKKHAHNRLQTKDNLVRRRIITLRMNINYENFAWIGEEVRVPPGDCRPHFWQHQVGPGEKETIFNWWVIWIAVIWALWSHQNIISFRLETCCAGSIKDMIKFKSWE